MATRAVSVEKYLDHVYRPDVDYVDGELESRNVGDYDHGALQAAILAYFRERRILWNLRIVQEVRMRINQTRYRIPDTALFSRDQAIEQVFTNPPLVCIEVLSPRDRISRYQERIEDYFKMGVRSVWILDPRKKIGLDCVSARFADWKEATIFEVPGTPIRMELANVFAEVD